MNTFILDGGMPSAQSENGSQPSVEQPSAVEKLCDSLDADLFVFSGPIGRVLAKNFIEETDKAGQRENCALVLCSNGGDPDAAYIIARILKTQYKKFTLYVFGYCKSAGSLIALGADEIVMSNKGELGPLDVQVLKSDELLFRSSGLDISQAIESLSERAYDLFYEHFINTILRGGGAITTKTASEIATSLAVGLLSPITGQIDPLRVGEMERAINIAQQYGERLNDDPKRVERLIKDYPSHTFVIDYTEACSLFGNVRKPNEIEKELEQLIRSAENRTGRPCISRPNEKGIVSYISPRAETDDETEQQSVAHNEGDQQRAESPNGNHPKGSEQRTGEQGTGAVHTDEAASSAPGENGQRQQAGV